MPNIILEHAVVHCALTGLKDALSVPDTVFPLSVVGGAIGPNTLAKALSDALGVK